MRTENFYDYVCILLSVWYVLIFSKLCLLTDHLCSFSLPMRAGQGSPNLPKTYEEDKIELAADIQDTQNAKVLNTKANFYVNSMVVQDLEDS